MRILAVCDVLFPQTTGGSGRVAREVGKGLRRLGCELRFLSRRIKGRDRPEKGLTYYPAPGLRSLYAYRRALQREITQFDPQVIHIHQPLPAFLMGVARLKLPTIYTFHSCWPEEFLLKAGRSPASVRRFVSLLQRSVERGMVKQTGSVVVLSRYSQRLVASLYGRSSKIIPGGVDSGTFQPQEGSRSEHLLRTLRNLVPRMGLDTLIEAMTLLPRDIELEIAGDGPLRSELERSIARFGLGDRVRLVGSVPEPDLPSFYSGATAFVLPSRAAEGFGLVILESLACGTPVLGTDVGAIPELLETFDSGWVLGPCTPESIAAGIERFLQTAGSVDAVALHETVAARFDWDEISRQYLAVLADLVS